MPANKKNYSASVTADTIKTTSAALNRARDVNTEDVRHADFNTIQALSINVMKLSVLKNILNAV